jgi:sugar phosphate isomerase/epimerase/dTDP-4-dehydrorhamnose reductase
MNALIGWTGFVGQNLFDQMTTEERATYSYYNSENVEAICGKSFTTLICAGMPASKWIANANPKEDRATLDRLLKCLRRVQAQRVVLISTVDVLDCSIPQKEKGTMWATHPYGVHRKLLEDFFLQAFPDGIVLRLPGLFGQGLKKNILYDLPKANVISNICLDSQFQWYDIADLWSDFKKCRKFKGVVHLVSEPVTTREIVTRFFPQYLSKCQGSQRSVYDLQTQYFGPWWQSKEVVLRKMGQFFARPRPSLVASTLGFSIDDQQAKKVLDHYEIQTLEIAPTQFSDTWDPVAIVGRLRHRVSSMQSLLWGTDLHVNDTKEVVAHFRTKVLPVAEALWCQTLVFGSPTARIAVDPAKALETFRQLGDLCGERLITLCLEPNARVYGCQWLTTIGDTLDFLNTLDHPWVKLCLDSGNLCMEADPYPLEMFPMNLLGHVQISGPFLGPFDDASRVAAQRVCSMLKHNEYRGIVSYESRHTSIHDFRAGLEEFTRFAKQIQE